MDTQQREQLTCEALGVLEQSLTKAVETLTGLLDTQNEGFRRLVCKDIIGHILKYHEIQDLDERLKHIEAQVGK